MYYNLLEEKWIPVLYHNGVWKRVGILEAFKKAGEIRQIAASNPMDRFAILRFLLALLYWCRGNPHENKIDAADELFTEEMSAKLEQNREYFNLLGEGKRFYQYMDLRLKKEKILTSNYLVQEVPTGTNLWHFRHSQDKIDGLCPQCCAIGLLRLPIYATSGGAGKPPGINSKPPLYFIKEEKTLLATLHILYQEEQNLGIPAWIQPEQKLPKSEKVPLLLGLTWLPRRVWLGDPEPTKSTCIVCGKEEYVIRNSVFAGVGSTKTDDDAPARNWNDPNVIYETLKRNKVSSLQTKDALKFPDIAAGQWANILSHFISENFEKGFVVGFSTVKNDKYLEASEWKFNIHNLMKEKKDVINELEKLQEENSSIVKKIRPKDAPKKKEHKEIKSAVYSIRPHIEHKVCSRINELLSGGEEVWQEAAEEYRPMMKSIAQSLAPGFTTAALERRQQIANTFPNMKLKDEPEKESDKKKGKEK